MLITKPNRDADFRCLASSCPDTCCAGWEIIIDSETYEHYKSITGEFGERLKSKMTIYEDDEKWAHLSCLRASVERIPPHVYETASCEKGALP